MAFELIKVSELPELTTPSDSNVIPIQDGEYLKRISFENLKKTAVGDMEGSLAAAYDSTATYAVGDYCIYEGQLYRCTTAITTAEAWTSGHWTASVLTDDIASDLSAEASTRSTNDNALAADIAEALGDLAAVYSTSATYAVGDYCTKDGQLYRCTTAITTAEAWTAAHWSAVALGDDTRDLRSALTSETNMLKAKAVTMNLTPVFELGNITISSSGWVYFSYQTRVRTEKNTTLKVKVGDTIGLTDYTNAEYYVGWKTSDGTYSYVNRWLSEDYTFSVDAECVVVIRNKTEANQHNVEDLASLFFWNYSTTTDFVSRNMKEIKNLKKIPFCTRAGYISTQGGYNGAGVTTQEVFTNKIECKQNDIFTLEIKNDEVVAQWVAYALYDSEGNFISRVNMLESNTAYCVISAAVSAATAKYIVFTYRSYGTNEVSIFASRHVKSINNFGDIPFNHVVKMPVILLGGAGYPTIDSVARTITFPSNMTIFTDGETGAYNAYSRITSTDTTVDFSGINGTDIKIVYDVPNNIFTAKNVNAVGRDNEIVLATIRRISNGILATMSCPYYVDGKLYGIDLNPLIDKDLSALNANVKSINHRGYNTVAPENTLPAFKLSKKNGFSMVETDVEYTSDGVAVCLHDASINRTARNAAGTEIATTVNINSITYEQALTYDFGIWKSASYAGTKIPTFEQFIILCRNLGLHPYIELKTGTQAQTEGLVDMVKACGMEGKVTWISFSSTLLTYVKNYDASARLGFVVNSITSSVITTAQGLKTTTNEVFIDGGSYTDAEITLCKEADLSLEVWTINGTSNVLALDPYITGVTSDNVVAGYELYKANVT